jgi:hypothetical protein
MLNHSRPAVDDTVKVDEEYCFAGEWSLTEGSCFLSE